jgi:dTMP kinase
MSATTPGHRGVFVTIDGPGGVGKSTTTRYLHRRLATQGYDVHATAEPSDDALGRLARRPGTYTKHALACLVAADRYHHLDTEIHPALDAGRIVVSDRYVPSSYVLQRIDGVPLDFIEAINTEAKIPDLAVLLTAAPNAIATRIDQRGTRNRFETGLAISQAEVDLYQEATSRLTERGYPLVTIDTTHTAAHDAAELIADRIIDLAGLPPPEGPTA